MEFNINGNMNSIGASRLSGSAAPEAQASRNEAPDAPSLKITHAVASPEDITAAGIPESALVRDDALGKLVCEAFSLAPPPMPDFARLA